MCKIPPLRFEAIALVFEPHQTSCGNLTPFATGCPQRRSYRVRFGRRQSYVTATAQPTRTAFPLPCVWSHVSHTRGWGQFVLEIPRTNAFTQRERRAIIHARDSMSTLKLFIAGLVSSASPPVALIPPSVEYLIRHCHDIMKNVGEHLLGKHCLSAQYEVHLQQVVKIRLAIQSIADEHQCSRTIFHFDEHDQWLMNVPVYPIDHSCTEPFRHAHHHVGCRATPGVKGATRLHARCTRGLFYGKQNYMLVCGHSHRNCACPTTVVRCTGCRAYDQWYKTTRTFVATTDDLFGSIVATASPLSEMGLATQQSVVDRYDDIGKVTRLIWR